MYDWDVDVLALERARQADDFWMPEAETLLMPEVAAPPMIQMRDDGLVPEIEVNVDPETFRELLKRTFSDSDLALFGAGDPGGTGPGDGEVTQVEDVVVTGRMVIVFGVPFMTWGDIPMDGGGGGQQGGGGGGLGPDPDTAGLTAHDSICSATGAIRAAINALSTNNDVEHVAIVFRGADGQLYTSPPFAGAPGRVDWYDLSVWMHDRGVDFPDVVGIYHNHDRTTSTNDDPDYHRYPSNQYTVRPGEQNDWAAAESWVRFGVDPNQLRLLLEDQDGNVRSFSYADRDRYATMTRQEMENREDLPPVTNGCGS